MHRSFICVMITLAALAACTPGDTPLFSRIDKDDTGIDFVNVNHETERSNVLTYEYFYNGGGVAMGDINNDGLTDIYFSSNTFENKLYLNKGSFCFEDITATSGTACPVGWKTGVSMVDINADGYLDIYVCRSASPDENRRRNILLINNKDNTFTDKAKEYNLDDPSFSTQASFFDFDRDGDLDVLLLNHSLLEFSNSSLINPKNTRDRFPFVGNKLMRNDHGRFTDVSDSVGVFGPASNYGLGVSVSDINNDGWPDLYTGCDYTGSDRLLFNAAGKRFIDVTDTLSHLSKFTMGTDIADVNNDGLMDIFTADMLPEDNYRQKQLLGADKYDAHLAMVRNGLHHQYMRNMLHLNLGNGRFSEIGQLAGVSNTDWSWGALFADLDNDGMQDLFVTNGFKRDLTDNDFAKFKAFEKINDAQRRREKISYLAVIDEFTENKIPNYAFRNKGNLTFENVSAPWGFTEAVLSNGVAYADLDNDGDLDIVTNNINEEAGVYRNNSGERLKNNFLQVQLSGDGGNAFAIGANVKVYSGGKVHVREQFPVRGFQSSVDPVLHFGLGASAIIDSVVVQWPDQTFQLFTNVSPNRKLSIKKEGRQQRKADIKETLFVTETPAVTFRHRENEFIDFRVQALLPRQYSREGPAAAVGDVSGDGLEDLFFGGAKSQLSELWINGFKKSEQPAFLRTKGSEIVDATFVDVDGDKDLDLYAVTGGYEFQLNDSLLQDVLYINDGKGNFSERKLPALPVSGSCIEPADVDRDGDVDLFVGGRIVPGRYPECPETTLLINDGKGNFSIDNRIPETLRHAGMVTDGLWADLNKDEFPDLIVIGEWMPIRVFINDRGKLTDVSKEYVGSPSTGFWNCIVAHDFDGDGDNDFVIGNQGLNTQMKTSPTLPVTMMYNDFDRNGSVDPILSYGIQGKLYPYASRDELTEQLPSFKKRFNDYKTYSKAAITEVLSGDEISQSKELTAAVLETSYVRNDGNRFTIMPMPVEMQFSPVKAMLVVDVDGDGIEDIVSGGNISATRTRTGKMTGNTGFIFRGDGKGGFTCLPPSRTGIYACKDVRKIVEIGNRLIFVANNAPLTVFQRRKETLAIVKN